MWVCGCVRAAYVCSNVSRVGRKCLSTPCSKAARKLAIVCRHKCALTWLETLFKWSMKQVSHNG